jgi:hypothetical protein
MVRDSGTPVANVENDDQFNLEFKRKVLFMKVTKQFVRVVIGSFVVTSSLTAFGSASIGSLACQQAVDQNINRFGSALVAREIVLKVQELISNKPELLALRKIGQEMGTRVFLTGQKAQGLIYLAKLQIQKEIGVPASDKIGGFELNLTHYEYVTDSDVLVDLPIEKHEDFKKSFNKYSNSWRPSRLEVRSVDEFVSQVSSQSPIRVTSLDGLVVEVTPTYWHSVIEDLADDSTSSSNGMVDLVNSEIKMSTFSQESQGGHKGGVTPEFTPTELQTLRVLRFLEKAFRYDLKIDKNAMNDLASMVSQIDPKAASGAKYKRFVELSAKKLVLSSANLEISMAVLDRLGLREKLIAMGDPNQVDSFAWWLSRKPLPSFRVGQGSGRTAADLGIDLLSHSTTDMKRFLSIIANPEGKPNLLMSEPNVVGLSAVYGSGVYMARGSKGHHRGSYFNSLYKLHSIAREGSDFEVHGDYILMKNRAAIADIPTVIDNPKD